ncbi:NACHT domain-containing protein [Aetokthonos hydrillicola Thurmond2011]|jgi:GTPase SAR1 family protein|uniref:NACHT domain-containing protein n=1 Tax=Aetokthonos hydrillicola Thurmond2011 TaxID=2712845 RepID=A0AAP5ICQ3_9CYAN|nr:NACHT domain-containing protein [Aetokthonos hydrillicola]MBO3461292.1 NACHT domain-containing protein [Aetokthonos hydrillicola CCALA 1050]MBW4589630.1 NACHT domain-containing protein [Aetokthonos hydrillicola CCALA 1050]MDR9899126.1 NACHT domain-containing protein [Aetokthonos hydrillicola Thurmond2011]
MAVEVDVEVFKRLKQAYSKQCGSSPKKLVAKLNERFKNEVEKDYNLISERTIRSFFNDEPTPKIQEINLNYLCIFLLNNDSYWEALNQSQLPSIYVRKSWIKSYWEKIERECNKIKILIMNQPIKLNDIFVKVNLLEGTLKRRQVKTIEELLDDRYDLSRDTNNFGQVVIEKGLSGEEVVKGTRRLIVWGTAGAGKTTFLKYIATHVKQIFCIDNQENIIEQPLPFLIPLKKFAEDKLELSLADALIQEFSKSISDIPLNVQKQLEEFIRQYLEQGKCLILLDGLDEVLTRDLNHVYKSIDDFNEKYNKNYMIITCRHGACEYVFKDFVEVEIADFDIEEIKIFIRKWFNNSHEDKIKHFLFKLETSKSIINLAKNPLLLTLLCLIVGEGYDLPKNRYQLYHDAVEILLSRWDASRNIERENIYRDMLSRQRKINMLGEIAYDAFIQEPQRYFWHQFELEEQIGKFLENIDGVGTQVDTQLVLKTIETHHGLLTEQARGIYAFSHLTFQEYFTAQHILETRDTHFLNYEIINQHLTNYQWREVFVIIAGCLSRDTDNFLKSIFSYANKLVKSDELQKMLRWLKKVTDAFQISSSSWRIMYLTLDLDTDLYINNDINVDRSIAKSISIKLRDINEKRKKLIKPQPISYIAVNLSVIHNFATYKSSSQNWQIPQADPFIHKRLDIDPNHFNIRSKFNETVNLVKDNAYADLADDLISLQSCQPANDSPALEWEHWSNKLQQVMIQHLDIGYSVEFCEEDSKALDKYLYVINLLLDCLQGDSYVSKHLRDELIDYLLLPKESIPIHLLGE